MVKHALVERFLGRVQTLIPSAQEKYDASHASIIYFCALGLALLRSSTFPTTAYDEYTKHLWCGNGYRGSPSYNRSADQASVVSTYLCLAIRVMSGLSLPIDSERDEIVRFIQKCQNKNGSFRALTDRGETSMRHTYSAIAILALISRLDPAEAWIRATGDYILKCQNYDGAFGDQPNDESHAGLTYCAVATLKLCGRLNEVDPCLSSALIRRQNPISGGFNGRPHKPDDVCYSFWVSASLSILEVDIGDAAQRRAREFLNGPGYDSLLGGFVKTQGTHADPYHTSLGLAALSLLNEDGLAPLDPVFSIVKPA